MTYTLCTLLVEQLGRAGQLFSGRGNVTSKLIAIGKRRIQLVLRLPSGTLKKTARAASFWSNVSDHQGS